MKFQNENSPRLIESINLLYYGLAIIPIVAVVWLGLTGTLPQYVAILGIFAFFFWVFSFAFALYEKFVRRSGNVR